MSFEFLILQPYGSIDVLKTVINHTVVNLYLTMEYMGATPLWIAAKNNRPDVVELLLEYGADPNRKCLNIEECYLEYPLHMAAGNNLIEIVRLLLRYGAKTNVKMLGGVTPIFLASQRDHLETVQILMEAGADINELRDDGTPPLFMVVQKESPSRVLEWLVNSSKNPTEVNFNITNYEEESVLLHAVGLNRVENIKTLLKIKDLVLTKLDNKYNSPMSWAIKHGYFDIVLLLLDKGLCLANHQVMQLSIFVEKSNEETNKITNIMLKCTDPRIFGDVAINPFNIVTSGNLWKKIVNKARYWLPLREFHERFPPIDRHRIFIFLFIINRLEKSYWSRIQKEIRYKIIKMFTDY